MKIVFATGNPGKLREAQEILGEGFELVTPADAGIPEDIPETGDTLRANSLQKAQYIYEKTGLDCFADDTGLEVEILGGAPGVHTARYGGPQKNPADNIARLLREMACREREASVAREYGFATPHATRRARFRTSVTLILNGEKHFFDGIMEGQIARKKAGKGGFGYDPVFIPDGYDVTAAEITEEQKNTEDFEKMAALRPADDEYLKTGVFELARNRIVWLLILMISATFTGGIISHFQGILMREALLASFIPMLMDTGGNCGAQVSTLMIRGMAVGELDLSDCLRVLWKELRVGIVVAFVLCTINLVRMLVFVDSLTTNVAIIVNATLFVTIVCAKLVGCILPMGAKRLGFDPALMASPMLTTVVDSLTLAIYFSIASQFLPLA